MKRNIWMSCMLLVGLLLFTVSQTPAQVVFSEDFENGGTIPDGWTQEYVNGSVDWTFGTGGESNGEPSSAYEGSYNARFYDGSYQNYTTRLITPAINLGIYTGATLTFQLYMADWAGDQDTLKLYYKTSSGGSWTLLDSWNTSITSWTKQTIQLPNLSSDYYLAFEGIASYGYGVNIDSITVTGSGASGVSAAFSADVTSGTYPLTVTFTDESLGSPTSWAWDFGDGNTSTEQNPSHTYESEGTYTVSLTVSDGTDSSTETKTDYITVSAPPPLAADFTADVTSGTAPLTVNFTDLSTSATTWEWDFDNDGVLDATAEQNPSYTYSDTGTYTVSLTVTDGEGTIETETKTDYITVKEYIPPISGDWVVQNPRPQSDAINASQFVTADTGYAVGADGLLMKTTDAGLSWTVIETGESLDLKGLFFLDADTGFMVGNMGVVLSTTDGGQTFTEHSFTSRTLEDVYFLGSNTGFVVGIYGTFYQTTDGGSSWTSVTHPAGSNNLNDIHFVDSATGFIAGGDGSSSATMLKTTDSGATWSSISMPFAYEMYTLYFLDSSTGFTGGLYGYMARTTDGGSTWQQIGTTVNDEVYGIYFSDANNGVLACSHGNYISSDAGSNWTETFYNDEYYPRALSFPGGSSTGYTFGAGGHILKTSDDGNTWSTPFAATLRGLMAIDFVNEYQGMAVGNTGTAIYTSDAGLSWTALTTDETYYDLEDVAYVDPSTAYAVSSNGTVYKTEDTGASWTPLTTAVTDNLYGIYALSPSEIIATGYWGVVTKTTDGGSSWTDISTTYEKYLHDAYFFDSNTGIVVGGYSGTGKIYKTTDGGATWTEITAPKQERLRSILFLNSSTGFIVGDDGAIMKTTDGGNTWVDKSVSEYWDFYDVVFQTTDNGYVLGTGGLAYETTDGGETWTEMTTPRDYYIYGAEIAGDALYMTGMYGSVVRFGPTIIPPALTADFSATPLSGYAPLTVGFTDLSIGTVTSWNWNFGDGNSSSEQNPTHTYQSAGTYTVTLSVSDGTSSDSKTVTDLVDVAYEGQKTIPLVSGWNWFSLNVEQADMSVPNVLTSLADSATSIKSQAAFSLYDASTGWSGDLDSMHVENMFMINMNQDATLDFAGTPVGYTSRPLPLVTGWNWISYLPDQTETLDQALSGIAGSADFIKNQYGFSFYYADLGWYGLIGNMTPGDGYKIKVNTSCDLVYSVSTTQSLVARKSPVNDGLDLTQLRSDWNLNPHDYSRSMAVTGIIADSPELTENDIVIAYTGEEVRGVARIREFPLTDQQIFSLMVYGREEDEEIGLRLYRSESESYSLGDPIRFHSDEILGNGLDPQTFNLTSTGLENTDMIPTKYTLHQNYPNPFNPATTVRFGLPEAGKVKMVVYDLRGRAVARLVNKHRTAGWYQILWNGTDSNGHAVSSGVYICRIDVQGETKSYSNQMKMLLIK